MDILCEKKLYLLREDIVFSFVVCYNNSIRCIGLFKVLCLGCVVLGVILKRLRTIRYILDMLTSLIDMPVDTLAKNKKHLRVFED